MKLKGSVALVTGANRGLGKAVTQALVDAGAARVYAAARDPSRVDVPGTIPVQLDVTSPEQVHEAAVLCGDVTILVNNAGILETVLLTEAGSADSLRRQIEVNALGSLTMAQAFAPVIERNRGGMIVNILSVVSWFTPPLSPLYAASKQAALAITDGLRFALADRGIRVSGVYAGFIDTDMTAALSMPKTSAQSIANAILKGIADDENHILADARAKKVWEVMRTDPYGFVERAWKAAGKPSS